MEGNKKLNVSVVYEYTDPNRWCTPLSLANGFRAAGHYVEQYNLVNNGTVYLDYNIDYDICIVMDWRGWDTNIVHPNVDKIMLVRECADCPQNLHLYLANGLGRYDLLLCPAYDSTEELRAYGFNAIWWPHFADSSLEVTTPIVLNHPPVRSTRGPGSSHILDALSRIMPDKFLNKNGLSGQEHSEFLTRGLITVQHSRHHEYTRRISEAMLACSMMITDRLPSSTRVDELFVEDEDIIYYDSLPECISLINYYLSPEGSDKRRRIACNGYEKVKAYHTEKQRVETIINEYKKWGQ